MERCDVPPQPYQDPEIWVACPDPDCDYRFPYPEHLVRQGLAVVIGHPDRLRTDRCWLGGHSLVVAQQMIAMRLENNGRLTRAAHP